MKEVSKLCGWFEKLKRSSLDSISDFYAEEAFFKDPFNEVTGVDKIKYIFSDIFNHLGNPHFIFNDILAENQQAFLTWNFAFKLKGRAYTIHGSSHLKFNEKMKVIYHRDYWDVGEELLLKLPFIKKIYGIFRKKIGSSQ